MFKEQMNKLKKLLVKKAATNDENPKVSTPNKRKIENLAVFLIILIVTLIAINAILSGNDKPAQDKKEDSNYKILADLQTPNKEER